MSPPQKNDSSDVGMTWARLIPRESSARDNQHHHNHHCSQQVTTYHKKITMATIIAITIPIIITIANSIVSVIAMHSWTAQLDCY